jgi:hypothetical protein
MANHHQHFTTRIPIRVPLLSIGNTPKSYSAARKAPHLFVNANMAAFQAKAEPKVKSPAQVRPRTLCNFALQFNTQRFNCTIFQPISDSVIIMARLTCAHLQ